jgi:predicted MFS family arabinose efflux permease
MDPTTRLILVLAIGAGASSLTGRVLDPLVGELAEDFATPAATVALLGTAFALPYAIIQPILGPVGDAMGKQRIIRACLAVLALALAACAAAPDFGTLAWLRILTGIGAGGVFPLCIALVGDRVPVERRQVALSRLLVAGLTGQAVGGAMAAALAPLIGWRGVLLVSAGIALVGLFALRDPGEMRPPPGRRVNPVEALARYRQIYALRPARRLYLSVFAEGIMFFGIFPFLAPLFAGRGIGGATEAGLAVLVFAGGGFLYGLFAPLLLRRIGQGGVILLGGVCGGLALAGLALAQAAWMGIGVFVLLGLGFYLLHGSIQTRVTEVAPAARGSAVALHSFHFFLGQSLGPAVMGGARAVVGQEAALLACAAGVLALAVWLAPQGRKSQG